MDRREILDQDLLKDCIAAKIYSWIFRADNVHSLHSVNEFVCFIKRVAGRFRYSNRPSGQSTRARGFLCVVTRENTSRHSDSVDNRYTRLKF